MAGWTLVDTHPTQGRAFQRPLDKFELFIFWGSLDGTTDSSHHYQLRLSNGPQDAHLFSEANIIKAWLSTKRRFPLVGATVRGANMVSVQHAVNSEGVAAELHFVVQEHDLSVLRPHEIVFGSVSCAEDAQRQAAAILHDPRSLSEELLAQLFVLRETASGRTDVLHIVTLLSHCVTDGTATRTLMRGFLDTLARGGLAVPAQSPLEERLATAVPPEDLQPIQVRSFSPARKRWRNVVGIVIAQSRQAKMQGGHTLPGRFTQSRVTARPGHVFTSLTLMETTAVIANCRLHKFTFGNAYLALAQVAMTRVLYRRYLRGEISEDEWAYRKRQPHITMGPLNLRRYLDEAWFDNGGGGEFVLSVGLFIYKLPFMTLGASTERCQSVLSDGAPPFSDLLSFDRFLHRARLVKAQATAHFSHPLFLEISHGLNLGATQRTQQLVRQYMRRTAAANNHEAPENSEDDKILEVWEIPTINAHGGSSLGNMDPIFPTEYPIPPTHPLSPYSSMPRPPVKAGYPPPPPSHFISETIPKITVEGSRTHLHLFPTGIYLGATTSRGQMTMFVHYDGNVYEEGIVKEWLDEVKGAVLWYLGRKQ